jgi:hypothetical protein
LTHIPGKEEEAFQLILTAENKEVIRTAGGDAVLQTEPLRKHCEP